MASPSVAGWTGLLDDLRIVRPRPWPCRHCRPCQPHWIQATTSTGIATSTGTATGSGTQTCVNRARIVRRSPRVCRRSQPQLQSDCQSWANQLWRNGLCTWLTGNTVGLLYCHRIEARPVPLFDRPSGRGLPVIETEQSAEPFATKRCDRPRPRPAVHRRSKRFPALDGSSRDGSAHVLGDGMSQMSLAQRHYPLQALALESKARIARICVQIRTHCR